jgi:hypothetical protein
MGMIRPLYIDTPAAADYSFSGKRELIGWLNISQT